MIGAVVLFGAISANAGAKPPTVVAPVTGFTLFAIPESPGATPDQSVAPTTIPGPIGAPEPSYGPHGTPRPVQPKVKAAPSPAATRSVGAHSIVGVASWYCKAGRSICMTAHPDHPGCDYRTGHNCDYYAAAGPALRAAICGVQSCTSWRNRVIYVEGIRIRLVDWCQCFWHQSNEKVVDLYWDVFARTGSHVTITW